LAFAVRFGFIAASSGRETGGIGGVDGKLQNMDVCTKHSPRVIDIFPPPPLPRQPSRWRGRLADDRRQLARFWPVIQNMVITELRVRYQRSWLGFVWTLLNPLLMMMTL
jgi:hypothetical protein